MPRLSVLLPYRDAAATLPAAIASLEAQSWRDFEVIAIDDGSTDGTAAPLDDWAGRDRRVRVMHCPPRGIVAALADALAAAGGELVARMDADDVALPARFARQVALLDAHPDVTACGTRFRYMPRHRVRDGARRYESWLNALVEPADLARDIFIECPIAHPTLMARRTAVEQAGGYRDQGWPEDYDLVLRLWEAGGALANVPEMLLHWREGDGRLSRVSIRYDAAAFRRCKVHFLVRTLLPRRNGVVVFGSGPIGKAFARELMAQGATLRAFFDVDPRKIGQTLYGVPVESHAALAGYDDAFAVGAVGSIAGRESIRALLRAAGRIELRDFCAVA